MICLWFSAQLMLAVTWKREQRKCNAYDRSALKGAFDIIVITRLLKLQLLGDTMAVVGTFLCRVIGLDNKFLTSLFP